MQLQMALIWCLLMFCVFLCSCGVCVVVVLSLCRVCVVLVSCLCWGLGVVVLSKTRAESGHLCAVVPFKTRVGFEPLGVILPSKT